MNQNLWSAEGHDVVVDFSLAGVAGSASLSFTVEGLTDPVEGLMEEDSANGVYRGTFIVSEASVGGVLFKPGEKDAQGASLLPKVLTLTVANGAKQLPRVRLKSPVGVATAVIYPRLWLRRPILGVPLREDPWDPIVGPRFSAAMEDAQDLIIII